MKISIKGLLKSVLFALFAFLVYMGVLYFAQNDFLFYPDRHYQSPARISLSDFSEKSLTAPDGTVITTWYHRGSPDRPAILFLHGNAGQIATFAPHLTPLLKAGYTVLIMEYRGFGKTPGDISQKAVIQDAAQAFDWLKEKGHSRIIVYGYSFGTAFASALTSIRTPDGLILTAPFSALDQLVSEKPLPLARFVLRDTYHSIDYLRKYDHPLLIVHGGKDRLIPPHHAQLLFEKALSQDKQLVLLEDETHASVFFRQKNIPAILKFLKRFE